MIIKKKEFAYSRKTREQWPFTVSEVAVVAVLVQEKPTQYAFAIVHNWLTYALSGILETQHGLLPLEKTGIWADDKEAIRVKEFNSDLDEPHTIKKSLTPFFQYLDKRIKNGC